jgi:hypothetical protein
MDHRATLAFFLLALSASCGLLQGAPILFGAATSYRIMPNNEMVVNPVRILQIHPQRGNAAILAEFPSSIAETFGLTAHPSEPRLFAFAEGVGGSYLYSFNPHSHILSIEHSFGPGVWVRSAVWDPRRNHYWINAYVAGVLGIFTLDPVSYSMNLVLALPYPTFAAREFAYSPVDDAFYLAGEGAIAGEDRNGLFRFHPDTLSLTWIGLAKGANGDPNTFNNLRALAWDPHRSRLLGVHFNTLVQVDTGTGAATRIGRVHTYGYVTNSVLGLEFADGTAVPYALPEPSTLACALTGLAFLILLRRPRRGVPPPSARREAA